MIDLNKNILKKIAKAACNRVYGFAPALNSIRLLEASGDGQYILFAVKDHEYCYDGITIEKRK